MKVKSTISSIAILLVITACATFSPEVPDSQKNCKQLGTAIEGVKEDLMDKIPYDENKTAEENVIDRALQTAFMMIVLPVKDVLVSEAEDIKSLTNRYRELMGYAQEKKCGFEQQETDALMESLKKLKAKIDAQE